MAGKSKDVTFVREDGVKVTLCAPRMPKKTEKTFSVDHSRYTAWTQGVSNFRRGTRGVLGTVDTQ